MASSPANLRLQIFLLTLGRWLLNTSLRFVYPFLPAIARGLGPTVSYTTLAQIVSWRNLAGLFSPFITNYTEKVPRAYILTAALLLFGLTHLAVILSPTLGGLTLAMLAVAFAKAIYDPTIQAYLGDQIPYAQRGRVLGITELGWSLSLLIGAPAAGWLIATHSWQAPFLALSLIAFPLAFFFWQTIPHTKTTNNYQRPPFFQLLRQHPVIIFAFVYIFLLMGSIEILFIAYGPWMESAFQLDVARLGITAGLIGGSEIAGELFVVKWIDRWGKRPVVITAATINALCYIFLPYLRYNFWGALFLLILLFCSFEVTAVGGLPLMTELVPAARGFVLSLLLMAISIGRAVGTAAGAYLWPTFGLGGIATAAAIAMLIATAILTLTIKENSDVHH